MHETAKRGFSAGAQAYEQGRPSYPREALQHITQTFALSAGCRVLDVGAGTGKMTSLLAATGASITALEPVPEMRAKLQTNCPAAIAVPGTAEQTGLLDASMDLVVVAQAFHWFDYRRATAEFARILRAQGGLSLVWNSRDTREPWVAEMSRVVRWNMGQIPTYDRDDDAWIERVTAGGEFRSLGVQEYDFAHELDADGLRARVLSISYIAKLSAAEQAPILEQVSALISDFPARFPLPYRTFVYDFCLK